MAEGFTEEEVGFSESELGEGFSEADVGFSEADLGEPQKSKEMLALEQAMGAKTFQQRAEEAGSLPQSPSALRPDQRTSLEAALAGTARGAIIPELLGKAGSVAKQDIESLLSTGKPATQAQKQEAWSQFSKDITAAQQRDPALGTAGEAVGAFAQPTLPGVGTGVVRGLTSAGANIAGAGLSELGRGAVSEDPNVLSDAEKTLAISAGLESLLRLPAPIVRRALAKVGATAKPAAEQAAIEAVSTSTQKGRENLQKYHPEAGRTLLDEGVVSFGASKAGMSEEAAKAAERANVRLNTLIKAAEKQGPIQTIDVVSALDKKRAALAANPATVNEAKAVQKLMDDAINIYGDTMTLADLRSFKGELQKKAFEGFSDSEARRVQREASGVLGDLQDQIVTSRLGEGVGKEYLSAQQQAGDIITAKKTLKKGKEPEVSLRDIAIGGAASFVHPAGALAPVAARELIKRYPASKAAILDWVGKQSTEGAKKLESLAANPKLFEEALPRLEKEIGIGEDSAQAEPEAVTATEAEPTSIASGGVPSRPVQTPQPAQPPQEEPSIFSDTIRKLNPLASSVAYADEMPSEPLPARKEGPSAEELPEMPHQKVAKKATEMIADFEKFTPVATPEPVKPGKPQKYFYGYGESGTHINPGDKISEPEARALLKNRVQKITTMLNRDDKLDYLNPEQKAAVASLVYNIGVTKFKDSKVYKKLASGDLEGAKQEWQEFRRAGGEVLPGLVERRSKEIETFSVPANAQFKAEVSGGGDAEFYQRVDGKWVKMNALDMNNSLSSPEFGNIVRKLDAHRKKGGGKGLLIGVE